MLRVPGVQKNNPCGWILDRELARGCACTLETFFLTPVGQQGLPELLVASARSEPSTGSDSPCWTHQLRESKWCLNTVRHNTVRDPTGYLARLCHYCVFTSVSEYLSLVTCLVFRVVFNAQSIYRSAALAPLPFFLPVCGCVSSFPSLAAPSSVHSLAIPR